MALRLASPAFRDGERIPEKYGYTAQNVNPPLIIEGAPDGTACFALLVDDPDAVKPAGKVWDHWIVWNIDPGTTKVPEGWDPGAAGANEGLNDYGERGYGGPNPPDREHTYRFELLALESRLDLPASTSADDVRSAAEGTIIDEASLTGTFAP